MKSNLIKAMMFIFVTLISLSLIGCSTANVTKKETIGIRGVVKEISASCRNSNSYFCLDNESSKKRVIGLNGGTCLG